MAQCHRLQPRIIQTGRRPQQDLLRIWPSFSGCRLSGSLKLREFRLIKPNQSSQELEAGQGGFLATPVVMKKPGAYTVAAATNAGFYTMYREDGRIRHKLGSKEGLDNLILSLYFENYTKALIHVGTSAAQDFATPVGHNIEIVPLENPYLKRVGDRLKIQVLFNGKPAPYVSVNATFVGFPKKKNTPSAIKPTATALPPSD